MSQRILVTGGAGQLGSAVCAALHEAGLEARAFDRVYRRDLPVPLEVGNLLDGPSLYRHLEGCDAVVHLGNYRTVHMNVSPQQLYAENVAMDVNVFQAAADVGVRRVVFSSSVQVIAGDRTQGDVEQSSCLAYLPMDGRMPACPRNAYALSKQAGELQLQYFAALDPALSCAAIRFPFLLDEGHARWMRRRRGHFHRQSWGNPDEGFSYLALSDASALILAVLERGAPGYHQCLPAAPDNYLAMPIPEAIEKFYQGVPLNVPADRMKSLVDISSIEQELGWRPQVTGVFGDPAADAQGD